MKFLITGLGSIGQRHYKNLLSLNHKDVFVYRTGKGDKKFVSDFEKEYKPVIFYDLNEAFTQEPDIMLVTNPTIFHPEFIKQGLKNGIKGIFTEKPIAAELNSIKTLINSKISRNTVGYVGYNFRFHPLLQKMKNFMDAGAIGKILSASVDMGEYLPDWHPWEDYRQTYPARKELGGGVVLTQSHDIDYLYWFFGMPQKIFAFGGARTGLEVNVDDLVKAVLEYGDGKIISLHMDFHKRPPRRVFEIMGQNGTLVWDYHAGELRLIPHSKTGRQRIFRNPKNFERNMMFIKEMKHFINCVKGKEKPRVGFEDGVNVLKICEGILKSSKDGKVKIITQKLKFHEEK